MEYLNYVFDLYGTLVDIRTDEERDSVWKNMAMFYALQGADYSPKKLKKYYLKYVKELEKCVDTEDGKSAGKGRSAEIGRNAEKSELAETGRNAGTSELAETGRNAGTSELAETGNSAGTGERTGTGKMEDDRENREIQLEKVWERLYSEKGVVADSRKVQETGCFFRALTLEKLKLFPGALDLLLRLRRDGKRVFLLSNAQRMYTEPEMKLLGIYDLFDGILYSSDTGWKKPSIHFYDILFQRYSLKKEESVMVGNDWKADAAGAWKYGIDSIYVHTKQSTKRKGGLPDGCRKIKKIGEAYI